MTKNVKRALSEQEKQTKSMPGENCGLIETPTITIDNIPI